MARPTVIRTESILEAARDVFIERGALSTSVEIARRAGVSEGSIFKRFRTKADLFRAAMGLDEEPEALRTLPDRAGSATVRENLRAAAREILAHAERIMPVWHSLHSHRREDGGLEPRSLIVWGEACLERYLEAEAELGRLRACDTRLAALIFTSTLVSPLVSRSLGANGTALDRDAYVDECVRIVWEGIRPQRVHCEHAA